MMKSGLLRWSPCLRRCQFSRWNLDKCEHSATVLHGGCDGLAPRSFLVVVRDRLVWQGEVLFLIEAHQVENVEVGDHELARSACRSRCPESGRGVRNDVVQENGVRVDGARGGCVLLTEIDVRDHV